MTTRRSRAILLSILMVPAVAVAQSGPWVPVGPAGGPVVDIDRHPTDPDRLVVVSGLADAGVFRTADGGVTWDAGLEGLDLERYTFAHEIAMDRQRPDRLFLATGNSIGRLYRSLDGGRSWTPADVERGRVNAVDLDPSDGDRVLYGTWEATVGRLFLSTDGGASFTEVTPAGLSGVWSILFDPFDGTFVYCGTGNGLWRSADGGWTWTDLGSTAKTVSALSADPHAAGTVYVTTLPGGLWRSDDRGETLDDILGNLSPTESHTRVGPDPVTPDRLWVGSGDGMFLTENGGASWEPRNQGLDSAVGFASEYVNTVLADSDVSGRVWAGGDSGLFHTVEDGASWDKIGPPSHHALVLTPDPWDSSQVTVGTNLGLYAPDGEGGYAPGAECVASSGFTVRALATSHDGWVYDGISTSFLDAALLRTLDGCVEGGATEVLLTVPGGDGVSGIGLGPPESGIVLAGIAYPSASGAAIYRSTEGGAPGTFHPVPGTGGFGTITDFDWSPDDPAYALAVSSGGGVFATNTSGLGFTPVRTGTGEAHYSIVFQPDDGDVVYIAKDGGIERSGDAGLSWALHSRAGDDVTALAIPVNDPDVMFASVRGDGVYRSEDRGTTWSRVGDGPGHLNLLDAVFRAETDRLFVGTRGGAVYALEGAGRIGPDVDLDSIADAIDNCPAAANPGQENADADPVGDACDCAPGDAGLYRAPGEITGVILDVVDSVTVVAWNDPRDEAGPATTSDVVSGDLSDLRSMGGFAAASCLGAGVAAATLDDTRPGPAAGEGFYYLVRASNACGTGSYGDSGQEPDPRDDLDASGLCGSQAPGE